VNYGGPILDNHFHVQRTGRFLEAVRSFQAAGGTHITLIPIPGQTAKRTKAEWRQFFLEHLQMSDEVEEKTGVGVIRCLGPYPIEFQRMAAAEGVAPAAQAFRTGYDAAYELLADGAALVMGEVGRPHFEVPAAIMETANELLEYGLSLAKDAGVPAILHTEHATPSVYADLARLADRAGLARQRVIKHYSGAFVTAEETSGLVPSIIASKSNLQAAISKGDRFLMETDYIDDLARPDVVLPPHQVPKRTQALAAQGVSHESLRRIHQDLPSTLYGLQIEEPGRTKP
jgi:TatD-related deoxyribonuclease